MTKVLLVGDDKLGRRLLGETYPQFHAGFRPNAGQMKGLQRKRGRVSAGEING